MIDRCVVPVAYAALDDPDFAARFEAHAREAMGGYTGPLKVRYLHNAELALESGTIRLEDRDMFAVMVRAT